MLTDERARGLAHAPGYPCLSCPARRAPRTRALSWGAPAAPRYLTIYEHGHTPCRCVDICCYTYCCTQLEDTVVASTRFQTARAIVAAQPQPAARHPRGRHRAAAAADCCHPRRRSHPCRLPPCRLRAAACPSIYQLHKVATFEFHYKDSALPERRIFMQLSRNLGQKNRNCAMKFGRPPDAKLWPRLTHAPVHPVI